MKRLILVADYNVKEKLVGFRSVSNSTEAMRLLHYIEKQEGHIGAVGAIDYDKSESKARLQLKESLKKKLLEKAKVKI